MTTVILQLICPDRPGLVSELSSWIFDNRGNIRHADHHTDEGTNLFLSRLEWDLDGFQISREKISVEIECLANSLGGKAQLHFSDEIPNVAIFVSQQSHCLLDLLGRVSNNELRMNVPLIISNDNYSVSALKNVSKFTIFGRGYPVRNDEKLLKSTIFDRGYPVKNVEK